MDQMADNKAVVGKKEETIKNKWHKYVQLPTKFEQNRQAFLEVIMNIESMADPHLGV